MKYFLCTLALIVGSLGTPAASSETGHALQLEVVLELAPRRDGPNQVAVGITNVGATSIQLPAQPGWDAAGGLVLRVTQVNGSTRTLPLLDEARAVTESTAGHPLPAGHSTALFRTLDGGELFFAGPGQYRLTVAYSGLGSEIVSTPLLVTVD